MFSKIGRQPAPRSLKSPCAKLCKYNASNPDGSHEIKSEGEQSFPPHLELPVIGCFISVFVKWDRRLAAKQIEQDNSSRPDINLKTFDRHAASESVLPSLCLGAGRDTSKP